jgi:UPF0716 protein FxsA
MGFLLLIAFIAVPITEIAVFIEVGGWIGLWPTIGIVILTAIIGTAMLRQQGISILFRIQENLEANKLPVRELFDDVCLVIAGAFLLTPGFVTDSLGFALFVPPFRHAIAGWIGQKIVARADVRFHAAGHGGPHAGRGGANYGPGSSHAGGDDIIDGEYEDLTDAPKKPVPPEQQVRDDR